MSTRHPRSFLVCIHDATPAFARETRLMIRDLAPLIGRRLSVGVVPDWDDAWPLAAYPDYCRLLVESAEERLLHGYCHRRRCGVGPTTWLTDGRDEMNGLDLEGTHLAIAQGQRMFRDAFGEPARGFLAPAWQSGHVHAGNAGALGLEHLLGFFSLESRSGGRVPLATWSWDSGRWGWLGHVGQRAGWLCHALDRGVPALAIHPRDRDRGFWPAILRLTQALLARGYTPTTAAALIEAHDRGAR